MKILMLNNISYSIIEDQYDRNGNKIIPNYSEKQLKNIIDVSKEEMTAIGRTKQYVDGKFIDYIPASKYQQEKKEILKWFELYDNQVLQYNRAIRLSIPYDEKYGSIVELDNTAVEKAARLNEVNNILETEYGIK